MGDPHAARRPLSRQTASRARGRRPANGVMARRVQCPQTTTATASLEPAAAVGNAACDENQLASKPLEKIASGKTAAPAASNMMTSYWTVDGTWACPPKVLMPVIVT